MLALVSAGALTCLSSALAVLPSGPVNELRAAEVWVYL